MTQPKSGSEINRILSDKEFNLEQYETLEDLLCELGITDSRQYMFIGKRFEGDSEGIPLLPESSLKRLKQVVVISHHIGG